MLTVTLGALLPASRTTCVSAMQGRSRRFFTGNLGAGFGGGGQGLGAGG